MQRLRPCPSVSSSRDGKLAAPGLKLLDDEGLRTPAPAKPRPAVPRWDSLSGPMPLAGLSMPELISDHREGDEDLFDEGFLPPRQTAPDAKSRELPRFVPLPDALCAGQGDPWAVHSFLEMLRVYLPEVSISVALVAGAGILGGRLASRFAGVSLGLEILAAYVFLQLLFLGLNYQSIKGSPYLHSKETLRKMLLASFLILGVHILAYGLLVAGR